MSEQSYCPNCGGSISVEINAAVRVDKRIVCPHCGVALLIRDDYMRDGNDEGPDFFLTELPSEYTEV